MANFQSHTHVAIYDICTVLFLNKFVSNLIIVIYSSALVRLLICLDTWSFTTGEYYLSLLSLYNSVQFSVTVKLLKVAGKLSRKCNNC